MSETETIAAVIVEAVKAATAPLFARCAALEAQVSVLESRAPVPGPPGPRGDSGPPGQRGVDGVNGRDGVDGKDAILPDLDVIAARAAALVPRPKDGLDGKDGRDGINGTDGIDGRDGQPGVPGVPGRDGEPGARGEKGEDGAAGRDGTLEGATVKAVDDRAFELLRADGSRLGLLEFTVPLYRGVFTAGSGYAKGDAVTFGGSLWIAREATRDKPGDGATAWQLAVKAGREGREGKPGRDGAPGPKGERGDPGRNFS